MCGFVVLRRIFGEALLLVVLRRVLVAFGRGVAVLFGVLLRVHLLLRVFLRWVLLSGILRRLTLWLVVTVSLGVLLLLHLLVVLLLHLLVVLLLHLLTVLLLHFGLSAEVPA